MLTLYHIRKRRVARVQGRASDYNRTLLSDNFFHFGRLPCSALKSRYNFSNLTEQDLFLLLLTLHLYQISFCKATFLYSCEGSMRYINDEHFVRTILLLFSFYWSFLDLLCVSYEEYQLCY